jgi:hypothetical protein
MKITTREVVFGLLILVALVALRVFWPTVKAEKIPSPTVKVTAIDSTACIAPTEYMRSHHMQLLNEWRNTGARDNRPYVNAAGKKFQKSLDTCLGCHSNNTYFCISCHQYANAKPNCWNCHLSPLDKP